MNKDLLRDKLTELIAMRLNLTIKLTEGLPPDKVLGASSDWRERYKGHNNIPPNHIFLNGFKNEVDNYVADIMGLIDESLPSSPPAKEKP